MKLTAESKCNVLFVGFTVPRVVLDNICLVDRFMPIHTHKFSWSIVHGLELNEVNVDLISAQPVGAYPANRKIIFGFERWDRGNSTWNIMLPFVNLIILRHISRFLVSFFLIGWWVIQTQNKQDRCILLHGVHSPFMYSVLAIKQFCQIKAVTIVTDPPGVALPLDGFIIKLFRRLDVGVITKALRSMDGLIVLTNQLTKQYAPQVPSIVMEGILNSDDYNSDIWIVDSNSVMSSPYFTIVYAGGLEQAYGIELLLKSFSLIKDTSFRLQIYGRGQYADQIKTASLTDSRVILNGFVSPDELRVLLAKANLLINPRQSNQSFTHFTFPSKIIEYMASGRPVLTTRLSGIPVEYNDFLYYFEDESPEGLAQMLQTIRAKADKELDEFGARARDFIINHKNAGVQGKRIVQFIHTLKEL